VPGILLSVVERVNPSGSVFQKGRRITKQDRHRALNQDTSAGTLAGTAAS